MHGLILLGGGVLTFFWLLFMLADYGWERKKRRGLDLQVRTNWLGKRQERATYEWYSWIRYLAIILLTYINVVGVIDSEPEKNAGLASAHVLATLDCDPVLNRFARNRRLLGSTVAL